MKPVLPAILICMVLLGTSSTPANPDPAAQSGKLLRHVVLFAFKADTPPGKLDEIIKAFEALPSKIPEIKGFEWGLNNSPEGLNKGFTHCFTLTFDSEEGRSVYLPHPDHKAFGELAGPYIADVLVVDYWADAE